MKGKRERGWQNFLSMMRAVGILGESGIVFGLFGEKY